MSSLPIDITWYNMLKVKRYFDGIYFFNLQDLRIRQPNGSIRKIVPLATIFKRPLILLKSLLSFKTLLGDVISHANQSTPPLIKSEILISEIFILYFL
jgi:hypothetical protein